MEALAFFQTLHGAGDRVVALPVRLRIRMLFFIALPVRGYVACMQLQTTSWSDFQRAWSGVFDETFVQILLDMPERACPLSSF
jgi:hypothetical protein